MNTKEVARLSGVSVRALQYYDKIGLLRPKRNPTNSYREYSQSDLDRLQQILFFKECGFPLVSVQKLLSDPSFDREKTFQLQKKYLLRERKRLDTMLATLEKTMESLKGEFTMTQEEKFVGFDFSNNPYEEEARRLWGDEAVSKSNARLEAMSLRERGELANSMEDLFRRLAAVSGHAPDSPEAQSEIAKMYRYFNESFGYHYTLEAFAAIGQLYVSDGRFSENIDKYAKGLAEFLSKAMRIYADN